MGNIIVVYGSVRTKRQGIKAARFIVNQLKKRGHHVSLLDPLEHEFPLLDKRFKEFAEGEAPAFMAEVANLIINSDGVIVVSGEYNHTIPPALSNLMDHYLEEWYFKPAAIVTYSGGGFGGVRSSSALRSMLGEMGMPVISTEFPVSRVRDSFTDQGEPLDPKLNERVEQFLNEFEWYVRALQDARKTGTPF